MFSLTEKDKFTLINKAKAIFRYPNKSYLCFGNDELKIADKANVENNSMSYLNNRYYVNNKYSHNPESYQKLNGNENYYFTVKEWEVFQIRFE